MIKQTIIIPKKSTLSVNARFVIGLAVSLSIGNTSVTLLVRCTNFERVEF